jgi:hypothetical protein
MQDEAASITQVARCFLSGQGQIKPETWYLLARKAERLDPIEALARD